MTINYPTSLDTFFRPLPANTLGTTPHSTLHGDERSALEALEAKVGIDSSAVSTSLDYKVGKLSAAIVPLGYYGPLDTQAHIRAALDLFFADANTSSVEIPDLTISEQYTKELTAGQHKKLYLSAGTILNLTSANSTTGTIFDFFTQPEYIVAVSAITRTASVDLTDNAGDADSANTVDVLTIGSAKTVTKYDIFKLTSDDVMSNAKQGSNSCYIGEFVIAGLDSVGTSVTLTAPIREINDTYTTNKRLGKMIDASVQIFGGRGTFDSSLAGTSGITPLIRFTGLQNVRVVGFEFTDALSQCIQFEGCYGYEVLSCKFRHALNAPAANHYGYGIDDVNSEQGKVHGCHSIGARHMFTTNGRQMTTNKTGRSYWYYGRTRNFNVGAGCTSQACSNAPYDTHDEADGGLFAGIMSHGTYSGADSAGGSLQIRGMNITVSGGHGEGSYGGAIMRTSKGGVLSNYTSLYCRTPAFVTGPGNSTVTQNCEARASDCKFGVLDVNQPCVNITAASTRTNKTEIIGGMCKLSTTSALAISDIIRCNSTGTTLYLDNVLIDLSDCFVGTTLAGLVSVVDGVTVRGKIRVKNTANCTIASILRLTSGVSANADVQLTVVIESTSTNGVTNCSTQLPHGVNTTTFTAAKLAVTIKTTGGTDLTTQRTVLTSSVVLAGATLNLKGNLEDDAVYRLQPVANLTGGTNGLTVTPGDLSDGMTRTFQNNSNFTVQFISGFSYTLSPGASCRILGTGSSMVIVAKTPAYTPIDTTANYTTGQRDDGGCLGLNHATGQILTLAATSSIGTQIRMVQTGAGPWSIASTGSGTVVGTTVTKGQYSIHQAEVIANSGGSAAQWLVSQVGGNPRFQQYDFTQHSYTGGTGKQTLTTLTIPAKHGLVAGSRILIGTLWSFTGANNNRRMQIALGATDFMDVTAASTVLSEWRQIEIFVRTPASSQIAMLKGASTGWGTNTSAPTSSSEDLSAGFTITVSGTLTNGSDSIAIEAIYVDIINPI